MKSLFLAVLSLALVGCASAHRGGAFPTGYRAGKAVAKAVAPPVVSKSVSAVAHKVVKPVAKGSKPVLEKAGKGAKVALFGRPSKSK